VKRSTSHVVLSFAVAGLLTLATGLAAGQMMGQEKAQPPAAATQPKTGFMQSMMAEMRGMMAEMQGMMQAHQGMMAGQGMPGRMGGQQGMMSGNRNTNSGQEKSRTSASAPSKGNWTDMMRSMHAMGASLQQMMTRMDTIMSNKDLMASRAVHSDVGAMQEEMRSMMGSLDGMIHHMGNIQRSQPGTQKQRPRRSPPTGER
jgi:hypothetical protein